ncbi:AraC family transcriptional regulator [Rapidithrix thailandica]|uniref:AraC family transcriptional regulator n=1 Tax=Rapidithrix thailandica TaxID=413964 RepID=A0AAW9SBU1_9BACT
MKYKMSIDNTNYQFKNRNTKTSEVDERKDTLSDNNGFDIDLTNVFLEGIHLKWGKYQSNRIKTYSVSPEKESVVAHFCLRGSCVSEHKSYLNIERGECMLFKEDKDDYLFHMDVDQGIGEFFEVSFCPDLYALHFADHAITDRVFKGKRLFASISKDPVLRKIITEIYQRKDNYSGKLKRLYIESKVSELLLIQLCLLQDSKPTRSRLYKNDIEAIHHAKDIISKDLEHTTIPYLAVSVGINQTKLKTGFKELFGQTIFEFLTNLRMKKAHHLLLSTELTISEIASSVGYNYPQHFMTAFKRYFGCTPNEVRKS